MTDVAQDDAVRHLVDAAARRYHGAFSSRFARGKLSRDPLFATLLRTAAIPDAACLVDLGCGQGLLAVWLHEARIAGVEGRWPAAWPPAPKVSTYLGIDRSRMDVRRARDAFPPFARAFRGDVRTLGTTLLDRCDVVTLLDVLQYLDRDAQETLFASIARGLPPWGVVVMRVGDGAATRASRWSNGVDLVVGWLRGQPQLRLHRRSIAGWTALLEGHGFVVETLDDPRHDGDPRGRHGGFANVLMRATRGTSPTGQAVASTADTSPCAPLK